MKLEEIPESPPLPELVETESSEAGGLDLLGLRAAAESVAGELLNGITTVTPTARYVGLYAWIIKRYVDLGGPDRNSDFIRFAKKVEAAFVMGSLLADPATQGLVGADEGGKRIVKDSDTVVAGPLVQTPAVRLYGSPCRDLGISWERPNVPGLTEERGQPLAVTVEEMLGGAPALEHMDVAAEEQAIRRSALAHLGRTFPLTTSVARERELLIEAIIPSQPQPSEVNRVRTYCMLLHMMRQAGSVLDEQEVFDGVLIPNLDDVPVNLQSTFDGWARFVVRDMLVAIHEAVVSTVCSCLGALPDGHRHQPIQEVLAWFAGSLDHGLVEVGFPTIRSNQPIRELTNAVQERLTGMSRTDGLRRWESELTEAAVADWAVSHQGNAEVAALLPVAWLLAHLRLHDDADPTDSGMSGYSRMGVRTVVGPAVAAWMKSDEPIRDVVTDLVRRSVEQHLRIAWSRLAREPWKDVAVLSADQDEWIFVKELRAGRAASRIGQAIRWL